MNNPMLDSGCLPFYEWLDVPIWVFDAQRMRKAWANAAGLAYWRAATLDELLARDYSDASPDARARLKLAMQAHARGEVTRECWTLYPDGHPVTCKLLSRGFLLADGRQALLFIAERQPASLDPITLRGVEAVHRTSARISLHSLADGAVLMRNTAAQQVLGPPPPPGDHADNPFLAMFVDREAAAGLFRDAFEGRSGSAELQLRTLQGDHWHAVEVRPVPDPASGERALHFNARDIGDFKAVQQSLELARGAADAAQLAKTEFLANMSHEIRTPMNGVLGLTELALRSEELSDRQRRFISLANQSARGLMVIIDDLLDVARLESGQATVARLPFSVGDCVTDALALHVPIADTKGLRLGWHIDPGVPATVLGDSVRLRQVITHLVGNALKFTSAGEVQLQVCRRDDPPPTPADMLLGLTVRDTGIGMTQEELGRVFEPFTQGDASSARRYGGAGLGLTIVARSVALMGGTVTVDSRPGVGSCFEITVRVGRPDAVDLPAWSQAIRPVPRLLPPHAA
jgi:signal transduction histidine kinase